jgi:N-carbamoylputrescine amidase
MALGIGALWHFPTTPSPGDAVHRCPSRDVPYGGSRAGGRHVGLGQSRQAGARPLLGARRDVSVTTGHDVARRTLRVASIQLQARLGEIEANLRHAEPFVTRAAAEGAALVVLPELFNTGYLPNRDLWRHVESSTGRTVQWLTTMAHRFELFLGGGFAVWDGDDVINGFALAGPDGTIVGSARKSNAEAYLFRRGHGAHVIQTAIGRIGVGICADCQSPRVLRTLHDRSVDLVLMPHAAPTPAVVRGAVSEADIWAQRERLAELPVAYARSLGVPAIFVNQTGPMAPMSGILGRLMDPAIFRLQGGSRIVDSDASVVGALGDVEDVLVADVTLDQSRRTWLAPRSYGGWLMPGSSVVRKLVVPADVGLGRLSYRLGRRSRRSCRTAASGAR